MFISIVMMQCVANIKCISVSNLFINIKINVTL